ncbi:MAG: hypothetical protein ACE5ID_08360, partial [Acidobacteriota bacterium]
RHFTTASSLFLDLMESHPNLAVARIGYAVSQMALDHNAAALEAVLEGRQRTPGVARLHELLGDLMFRADRLEEALAAWRQAQALEASARLTEKIDRGTRLLNASRVYRSSTSAHFVVRHDDKVDGSLAAQVLKELEQAYDRVSRLLDHSARQPITVVIHPEAQFRWVTSAPSWATGLFDGKIHLPMGGRQRLDPVTRQVLVHELTHAMIHFKTHGHCPRWLQEGMAQILAGRKLGPAQQILIQKQLDGLPAEDWESRGFSYPIALSLTRHLKTRWGFQGLVHLLDRLGRGDGIDAALRRISGQDYRATCREWAAGLHAPRHRQTTPA